MTPSMLHIYGKNLVELNSEIDDIDVTLQKMGTSANNNLSNKKSLLYLDFKTRMIALNKRYIFGVSKMLSDLDPDTREKERQAKAKEF